MIMLHVEFKGSYLDDGDFDEAVGKGNDCSYLCGGGLRALDYDFDDKASAEAAAARVKKLKSEFLRLTTSFCDEDGKVIRL